MLIDFSHAGKRNRIRMLHKYFIVQNYSYCRKLYAYISSLYLAPRIIDNHLTIADIALHGILFLQ